MFIGALFIKTWKKTKFLSVGEWVNKRQHMHTTEYYSALKRNELSSPEKTWGNLKGILLSERSQSEKTTYCRIPTIGHSGKSHTMDPVKRSVVPGGGGKVMNRQSTGDF